MAADGERIIKEYNVDVSQRAPHMNRWERMAPFLAPSRVGMIGTTFPGQDQQRNVYDSTTLLAAELMAQFLAGQVMNPTQRWMEYDPATGDTPDAIGAGDSTEDDEAKEWAEEARDRTLKRVASSMFYGEATEVLTDYVGFGTGLIIGEEAPQPINETKRGFRGFLFTAVKTGRFTIREGNSGLVERFSREHQMSMQNIMDRWGTNATIQGSFPESIKNAIASKKTEASFKIIHSVYPRPRAEQNGGGAYGAPWASCWVDYDSKHVIQEAGYRVFPAAVPRYHRTPGDDYGRGRGDIAFPDTWTLNSAKRMGLEDWALKIRPPIMHRSDSVMQGLRLVPAGANSINTHGRPIGDAIMPWQTGSHPEVSHINEEEIRKTIRTVFFVEQILQLLEVNKSEMTAFEFAKKINLLFQILGPVYSRFLVELIYRIVENMFELQYRAGDFPPPPPSMLRSSGKVELKFSNPIERAQRAGDAEGLVFALSDLAPLAQQYPDMLDWLDRDKAVPRIFALRGVPASWTNTLEQVTKIRTARAEQHKIDLELARAEQMAKVAQGAAPLAKVAAEGGLAGAGLGGGVGAR